MCATSPKVYRTTLHPVQLFILCSNDSLLGITLCIMYSYSDTSDRLIVCAALLGRIYKDGYNKIRRKSSRVMHILVISSWEIEAYLMFYQIAHTHLHTHTQSNSPAFTPLSVEKSGCSSMLPRFFHAMSSRFIKAKPQDMAGQPTLHR